MKTHTALDHPVHVSAIMQKNGTLEPATSRGEKVERDGIGFLK